MSQRRVLNSTRALLRSAPSSSAGECLRHTKLADLRTISHTSLGHVRGRGPAPRYRVADSALPAYYVSMNKWVVVLVLVAVNAIVWVVPVPSGLKVSFLNIGQGDSILIEGPTGVQVLVDGGPDTSAVRELGQRLPFWDRTIDAVVATHPDADHIGGLPDVLHRYNTAYIFEPGVQNDTRAWSTFVQAANDGVAAGAQHVLARKGMRLILGGGAYADVLYPDHDVSAIPDTNSGSIVLRVVYGTTSFLLTGDLPDKQELYLVQTDPKNLDSDVLKAGHHGSAHSSTPEFVAAVSPNMVVYSRGCDNKYGHPAPRTVALFESLQIPAYDTCQQGTVTFLSDGVTISAP